MTTDPAVAEAEAWTAVDPDPDTRAELADLISRGDSAGLLSRFESRLTFGTAGLRGELGAGPNRMNRVVVRQAALGLVDHLPPGATVVIGFDARRQSDVFARDTAEIVAGSGGTALIFDHVVPTPVLAFAVTHLGADAGVMVTASHNPPADNGYKVYSDDGAQIISPTDREIEAAIVSAGLPPLDLGSPAGNGRVESVAGTVVESYLEAIVGARRDAIKQPLKVAYTPLHGVAGATLEAAFERAGMGAPAVVAAQEQPDAMFPTVSFPNPEEPGALDLLMVLGDEVSADVLLANDPDGDRLAAVLPTDSGWRALSGDELGALLAHWVITTTSGRGRLLATTIVSSRLLGRMAEAAGLPYVQTLTGFKWIARAADDKPSLALAFGYEEALGYSVGDVVRDKDGISAAVAFVDAVAAWRAEGRTPFDVLDELAQRHGVHRTAQLTIRLAGDEATAFMSGLRGDPPAAVAGSAVVEVVDRIRGGELPPSDVLEWYLQDGTRIVIRPSGTEPKVKVYIEVIVDVSGSDVESAQTAANSRLDDLQDELSNLRQARPN
jgi:phosphomannomutase